MADARPDLAAELVDFSESVLSTGSHKVVLWRCPNHDEPYPQRVAHRVRGVGCPYCAGKRVLRGLNDLMTTRPDLARELVGTDPRTITAGSGKRLLWRCPNHEEPYIATVASRSRGQGCGVCRGRSVMEGVNDLSTTHPWLAVELVNTDPTTITAKSTKRVLWRCSEHPTPYSTSPMKRAAGGGCTVCARKVVVPGFNDLATTHPELAAQLVGTDPTTVFASTMRVLLWRCPNHSEPYPSSGSNRVKGQGCGYCTNKRVLRGFNDLATTHPQLAAELVGLDPASITAGLGRKVAWTCPTHGQYRQVVRKRADGQGCPSCAPYGFDPRRPAYVYLAERPGEQQVGITGDPVRRESEHARDGWTLLDIIGPMPGRQALDLEGSVKAWLSCRVPLLPSRLERWSTADMQVLSMRDLLERVADDAAGTCP